MIKEIYFKSDFEVMMQFCMGGQDVPPPASEWTMRFYTSSYNSAFVCSHREDGTFRNCCLSDDNKTVRCFLDSHGLAPGTLKCEVSINIPDANYEADGHKLTVYNKKLDIVLVSSAMCDDAQTLKAKLNIVSVCAGNGRGSAKDGNGTSYVHKGCISNRAMEGVTYYTDKIKIARCDWNVGKNIELHFTNHLLKNLGVDTVDGLLNDTDLVDTDLVDAQKGSDDNTIVLILTHSPSSIKDIPFFYLPKKVFMCLRNGSFDSSNQCSERKLVPYTSEEVIKLFEKPEYFNTNGLVYLIVPRNAEVLKGYSHSMWDGSKTRRIGGFRWRSPAHGYQNKIFDDKVKSLRLLCVNGACGAHKPLYNKKEDWKVVTSDKYTRKFLMRIRRTSWKGYKSDYTYFHLIVKTDDNGRKVVVEPCDGY